VRRDRLDILADILQVIHNGNNRDSNIASKSGVGFYRFNKVYKVSLVKGGLIKIRNDSQSNWVLTERGCEYLVKYRELERLCPALSRIGGLR